MSASFPHYHTVNRLAVETHADRASMARAAARAAAAWLHAVIADRGSARVIFGCAPSQDEFLDALVDATATGIRIPWEKVTAFHMDEYVGLTADDPRSFRHYLARHLLDRVPIGRFHPIPGEAVNVARTCDEYAALVTERPIDLICLGIGENGHIAFNDPPVAAFDDPATIKLVELEARCRQQQVNDGCFDRIDDVPRHALTLTIPVFRHARRLSIHVPGERKAAAVDRALRGPIAPACPASILRLHPHATLYLDAAAASAA